MCLLAYYQPYNIIIYRVGDRWILAVSVLLVRVHNADKYWFHLYIVLVLNAWGRYTYPPPCVVNCQTKSTEALANIILILNLTIGSIHSNDVKNNRAKLIIRIRVGSLLCQALVETETTLQRVQHFNVILSIFIPFARLKLLNIIIIW